MESQEQSFSQKPITLQPAFQQKTFNKNKKKSTLETFNINVLYNMNNSTEKNHHFDFLSTY